MGEQSLFGWWKRIVETSRPAPGVRAWPEPDLRRAAARLEEVELRFDDTPWWQYRRLDGEHRSRTLSVPDWFPDWHLIRPGDVERLAELTDRPIVAAGLLSMHPSGYVREAAVHSLAATDELKAFPFLLVRGADWVEPVRLLAQMAVRDRLVRSRPDDLLLAMPLLQQMADERSRASEFASEVLDTLRSGIKTSTLLAGLTHDAYSVRRLCATLLAQRGEVTLAVLAIALGQDDALTTRVIGNAAVDQVADSESALSALWASPISSLRALALHRYQSNESSQVLAASEEGLFDPSPSVRFLAQRFLMRHGSDIVRRYRDALPVRIVAIQGLAEVGGPDDVRAIEAHITDQRVRARIFAVYAIGRLLGAEGRSLLLDRLDDQSSAVVKAVGRVLAREQLDPATLEQIWARTVEADVEALRNATFGVFMRQSRWPKLVLACRSIITDDEDLRRRGNLLLKSAFASWNSSSTKPSAAQINELDRHAPIIGRTSPAVQRELVDRLKHVR